MLKNSLLLSFLSFIFLFSFAGCGQEREPEVLIFALELNSENPIDEPEKFVAYKDDTVSIFVVSDSNETIHIHGYELVKNMKPKVQEVFIFSATATGRFEIASHGSHGSHVDHGHDTDHHSDQKMHDERVVAVLEIRPK